MNWHIVILIVVALKENHEGNTTEEFEELYENQLLWLSRSLCEIEVTLLREAVESDDEPIFEESEAANLTYKVHGINRRQVVLACIVIVRMDALQDDLIAFIEVVDLVGVEVFVAECLRLGLLLFLVHDVFFKDFVYCLE